MATLAKKYEVTWLDLGHLHPSRPGLVTITTTVDDDVITSSQVNVGNLHRGDEKLFEARDYRQIPMLASRHDWTAPFIGETGAAMPSRMRWALPSQLAWHGYEPCSLSSAESPHTSHFCHG
ncbi:NADH-ubiquinone oxidoreductase [Cutibacterium acnes JCM 18920]|nr:NADH-ubiquinone oxidoreductase [Cutibacterium acnes JCM 18920]